MNTFPSTSPTPPLCGVQLQYTGVPSWMADNLEWVWCGSLSLEFTGAPHATLGFAQNAWTETKFPTVAPTNVRPAQGILSAAYIKLAPSDKSQDLRQQPDSGRHLLSGLITPVNKPLIRSHLRPGVLQTGIFQPSLTDVKLTSLPG